MPKKPEQSLHSRPPLERMQRIHQAIHSGKFPNAGQLATEFEVNAKTIHRDIEFMRDRLGLPLEYDRARNGYCYTQSVEAFPTLQITEGELFALIVAEKALQQYRGTSFERPLLSAIHKMEQSLPDTVSFSLDEVEQTISFRTRAEPILDLGIFDILAKATSQRQQLQFHYRKPGKREAEKRVVDPYHLANINGEWYLFAFDQARRDIRTFSPARMQRVEKTGVIFERSKKFSLDKRLRDSFGVISGEGEFRVLVRFDATAADFIREKKWHPSQRLRELREGGVELEMQLSSLLEVQRWVLSWGGSATVLQPPELREAVKAAAERMLRS